MVVEDPSYEESRNATNIRLRKLLAVALLLLVIGVLLFSLTRLFDSNAPNPGFVSKNEDFKNTITEEELAEAIEESEVLSVEGSTLPAAQEETPLDEVLTYSGNTDTTPPASTTVPSTPETGKLSDGGYWIQLGAYSSEKTAASNGSMLVSELELEITPFIEEIKESGKTLYRLRLGPYPDRGESERILALTKIVDGFSGSFIIRK